MASNAPIEDSLQHFMKCNVCLEHVDLLKALPCQHTICLSCVKQLTVRKNRFKCTICKKENPVPDGGFDQLPDSLLTKRIADLIRQRQSGVEAVKDHKLDAAIDSVKTVPEEDEEGKGTNPSNKIATQDNTAKSGDKSIPSDEKSAQSADTTTSDSIVGATGGVEVVPSSTEKKPTKVDVWQLITDLNREKSSAESWHRRANEMVTNYKTELEVLPEKTKANKEAIIGYREKVHRLCQEKVKGVTRGLSNYSTELQDQIDKYRPYAEKIKEVLKMEVVMHRLLSAKTCSPKDVAAIQRCLSDLRSLIAEVGKNWNNVMEFDTIVPGDSVRLHFAEEYENDYLEQLMNGKVTHSSVGIFFGETKDVVQLEGFPMPLLRKRPIVLFPEEHGWIGVKDSICTSHTKANLPTKCDKVRVKESVVNPCYSWNGVRAEKSHGVLKEMTCIRRDDKVRVEVIVDFPEAKGWKGLYSEIELVPGCGMEAGDQVRVSRSIPEPSRGWRGVNGSSVGKVKKVKGALGHENLTVDFPECLEWIGLVSDLEMVREPEKGDKVQVKLSVKKPQLDWGGVTHKDVGELVNVKEEFANLGKVGEVKFPKTPKWSYLLDELEPARYQPPSCDPSTPQGLDIDDESIARRKTLLANMIHQMCGNAGL